MSKPFDTRVIEYAYVTGFSTKPNEIIQGGYEHRVMISYELQDADNNVLGTRAMQHSLPATGDDTVLQVKDAVAAALYEWIRADKIELSGFDMGPQ